MRLRRRVRAVVILGRNARGLTRFGPMVKSRTETANNGRYSTAPMGSGVSCGQFLSGWPEFVLRKRIFFFYGYYYQRCATAKFSQTNLSGRNRCMLMLSRQF